MECLGLCKSNKGDTIVEVLLAILVVGTVLGAAYVAANRYFNNVRQAQESSTALKIAEGQLEQIKSLSNEPRQGVNPLATSSPFCASGGNLIEAGNINCTDSIYEIKISRDKVSGEEWYTFTVDIYWYDINGGAKRNISLPYRIYE